MDIIEQLQRDIETMKLELVAINKGLKYYKKTKIETKARIEYAQTILDRERRDK